MNRVTPMSPAESADFCEMFRGINAEEKLFHLLGWLASEAEAQPEVGDALRRYHKNTMGPERGAE